MCRTHTFAKSTVAHTFVLLCPIETVHIARCPLIQSGSMKTGKDALWPWYSPSFHRWMLTSGLDVRRNKVCLLSRNGRGKTHKSFHMLSCSPYHGLSHRTQASHNGDPVFRKSWLICKISSTSLYPSVGRGPGITA